MRLAETIRIANEILLAIVKRKRPMLDVVMILLHAAKAQQTVGAVVAVRLGLASREQRRDGPTVVPFPEKGCHERTAIVPVPQREAPVRLVDALLR